MGKELEDTGYFSQSQNRFLNSSYKPSPVSRISTPLVSRSGVSRALPSPSAAGFPGPTQTVAKRAALQSRNTEDSLVVLKKEDLDTFLRESQKSHVERFDPRPGSLAAKE